MQRNSPIDSIDPLCGNYQNGFERKSYILKAMHLPMTKNINSERITVDIVFSR